MITLLRVLVWALGSLIVLFGVVWVLVYYSLCAEARDLGQWPQNATTEWFKSLNRPDMPDGYSCCGEADAYWCDDIHVKDGHTFCTITDDRDDGPLQRPHVPVGTEIEIPDQKLKWDRGNPTGHSVLFYAVGPRAVLCFVQGNGM